MELLGYSVFFDFMKHGFLEHKEEKFMVNKKKMKDIILIIVTVLLFILMVIVQTKKFKEDEIETDNTTGLFVVELEEVEIGMSKEEVAEIIDLNKEGVTSTEIDAGLLITVDTVLRDEQYHRKNIIIEGGEVTGISVVYNIEKENAEDIEKSLFESLTAKHGRHSLYIEHYIEDYLEAEKPLKVQAYEKEYTWNLDDENAVIRLFVSVPINGTIEISSDYIAISDN